MTSPELDATIPWFRKPHEDHTALPFKLTRKITNNQSGVHPLQRLAFFPWNRHSIKELWKDQLEDISESDWTQMILEFAGALVVAGDRKLHIFFVNAAEKPITINLPQDTPLRGNDSVNAAWCICPEHPLDPLVVFSFVSVLYVYNVKQKKIVSSLRGHGGSITSIAVHPQWPHILCTTSRDFSIRVYNLSMPPREKPQNVHWPPSKVASFAGPAHGLGMSEPEGIGSVGRCVVILMGGRSGGHRGDVLGADFHPNLPVLATCGMDRTVKIWHLLTVSSETLRREDKPLFSSSMIHEARVLSVKWLSQDILLSHSAPAIMRKSTDDRRDTYLVAGTLVLWRWLSVERFFPMEMREHHQEVLRGCASDYQESSSFKFLSRYAFPDEETQYAVAHVDVFRHPAFDPLALTVFPNSNKIMISNVAKFEPRVPAKFPDIEETLNSIGNPLTASQNLGVYGLEPKIDEIRRVEGWVLSLETESEEKLLACGMGCEGKVLVGLGSRGSVWIWVARKNIPN